MNRYASTIFLTIALALFIFSFTQLVEGSTTTRVILDWHAHKQDVHEDISTEKIVEVRSEIAAAIDSVTERRESRAILLTLVYFESGAAVYVYDNRCSDGPREARECDSGRAKGVFQLHGDVPDDVTAQAKIALGRFTHARRRCGGTLDGGFAGYATGNKCSWSGSAERVAKVQKFLRRL